MTGSMKTDIILVQPGPHRMQLGGAILHLPLALMSIAAWLRRGDEYGDRIRILDMNIRRLSAGDFAEAGIVGITAITGHQIRYGLQAARLAREANPDALIVWGGVHPSLLPEQTIAHDLADIVAVGEGERPFERIVEAHFNNRPLADIPGTCVLDDKGSAVFTPSDGFIDMNDLPLPAYDLVDVGEYRGIVYQFYYQSSRGCPFRCGFCYNTAFSGRKWRAKSAVKVVDELSYLCGKYGVVNFAMVDDEFFIDVRRAEAVFKKIVDRKIRCGMIASCRLDIVRKFSDESLSIMKKAGVVQIFFGAESGSDKTLEYICKDITREDIIEGARIVANAGIRPVLSFMSGFPGETSRMFEDTLDVIRELWALHPLVMVNGIFPFNAYPGTTLYGESVGLGLEVPVKLDDWGSWTFQYEPDNPWLDSGMRRRIQIVFYIVRFKYYLTRYEDRYRDGIRVRLLRLLVLPLSLSAKIRMSRQWFWFAWEWRLFALLVRKTFGYL